MKLWIGLGDKVINQIERRRERKLIKQSGPLGDWYRGGAIPNFSKTYI